MTLDIVPSTKDRDDWFWPSLTSKRDFDVMDMEPWINPSDSPWAAFNRLSRQMEKLHRHFFERMNEKNDFPKFNDFNVKNSDDTFQVEVDVQGYKPEELIVSLDNNLLTLKGKHEERSSDGSHFVSRQFMRSMTVPNSVEMEKIQSKLTFGGRTLQVQAPIKKDLLDQSKTREIPIQITHTSKPAIESSKQG